MVSDSPIHRRNQSTPHPIPLPDDSQQQDVAESSRAGNSPHRRTLSDRGRSSFRSRKESALNTAADTSRYEPIEEGSPSPPLQRETPSIRPVITTPSGTYTPQLDDDNEQPFSPSDDPGAFQTAMGFGLSFENPSTRPTMATPSAQRASRSSSPTLRTVSDAGSIVHEDMEDVTGFFPPEEEADTIPLQSMSRLRANSASETPSGQRHDRERSSFQSARFLSPTVSRLGGDHDTEAGLRSPDHSPSGRQRSLSPASVQSPLHRASTMMRKISMRVVNLSNEPEVVQRTSRRKSSVHLPRSEIPPTIGDTHDFATDGAASIKSPVSEKVPSPISQPVEPHFPRPDPNPLRGKSSGIFPPDSKIRSKLCDLLVHPATEPFILLSIVIQTILLAIDSSHNADGVNVYRAGHWWDSSVEFGLLVLFAIYTVEIIIRIIVSGFIMNPIEYSTINRDIGLRQAVLNKTDDLFALHRKPSIKSPGPNFLPHQPPLMRTFTSQASDEVPGGSRQARRKRLAHRAFLRHSFNRSDFLAVVSFWISFVIGIFGVESDRHMYVFRMSSCSRISRSLGITSGTSVILRSLKRAAPALLNVALSIGFFWLLFAIIGVQGFQASLRRTCVWTDPTDSSNTWTYEFQFCGGHILPNGSAMPYSLSDRVTNGTNEHKGYSCPVNSLCIEGENPYNGTVSFDNSLQSLQLVFVTMTSNTFSDSLYYSTDSDYLAAALFFAAAIVIMSLWLINLLIAVITSSFQVIREEGKASAFTAEEDQKEVVEAEEGPPRRISALKRFYDQTHWIWIGVITYGLIVQCLRSASMSDSRVAFIDASELGVTLISLFEVVLRFAADWRNFSRSKQNIVDLCLAVITTVIQIPRIRESRRVYAWLSFFQIVRIYRVVLAVQLTRDLIITVLGNFSGLANSILFVFLLTFLGAIFASQSLRGQIPAEDDNGNSIDITFSTIYNSFLGMYQILSSENWTTIMYNVTNYNRIYHTAWIGAAFFIIWFISANFIVLNMFIAVIQENFDVSEDEKRLQQVKAFLRKKRFGHGGQGALSLSTIFKFGQVKRQDPSDFGSAATEMSLKDAVVRDFLDDESTPIETPPDTAGLDHHTSTRIVQTGFLSELWTKFEERLLHREPNPFYSDLQLSRAYQDLDPRQMAREVVSESERRKREQREYLRRHPNYNVSLFSFKPNNPIRKLCQRIVGPGRGEKRAEGQDPSIPVWYAFSAFIYAAIVAMVSLACVTTPLFQREYFQTHPFNSQNWFTFTDSGFAALFTLEALIKVIADGFFWTPNAYFRGSWGFIDGIVLITSWVNVFTSLYDPGGGSRAVGAFKALRALRSLNVSDSARDTFHSVIIMGGWKVLSAAFVSLSLSIPFAIYGLNLFNGSMMSCNDGNSNIYNSTDCVGEYMSSPSNWNVLAPRQVSNSYYDFDNFGGSSFILFQIVSQEGWIDVLWSANSITGVFTQPSSYASQGNGVFFVIFNLLGAVFVSTLFVSVFMRNYTEQTGVAYLTTDQRSWLELRKLLRQISPSKRPSSKKQRESWKEWCYRRAVTKNGRWQRAVTFALIFHSILLCLEFYPDNTAWPRVRDYIFLALTFFYIANIVIRIIGLSWTRFRRSAWDSYSIFSVCGTFVTTLLLLSNFGNHDYVQSHKLFLVSVALLLIPRNNQSDQLFKTAAASLNAIANLSATWFVLFLVFAIALTQTFGLTRFGENESDNINFRSVPKALILLFRTSVGEGWNQLMEDFASIVPPYCTVGQHYFDGDCGSPEWARALFILWNISSMYIFMNLFISSIYESFSYVYQRSSGLSVISREEIRRFKQAWAEFDPSGSGYIPREKFPRLSGESSGVFEMRIYDGDFTVRKILEDCTFKTPARASALPVDGPSEQPEVDLDLSNERLRELPVEEIRRRRERMNTFYEEVSVSADPDRGIEFNSLLMILAHYKVINDNKSLRLEEFLRRRARLQRVEEAVRRNVVVGFFDTLYWSRRFRRRIDERKNARMTMVPQLDVPEIFVHDESAPTTAHPDRPAFSPTSSPTSSPTLSTASPFNRGGSPERVEAYNVSISPGDSGRDVSPSAISTGFVRHRSDSIQISPSVSPTRAGRPSFSHSPSGSITSIQPEWQFAEALAQRPPSPGHLGPGGDGPVSEGAGGGRSRAGSAVSAQNVSDVLDNSAWGESIRRSFTVRRPSDATQRRPS